MYEKIINTLEKQKLIKRIKLPIIDLKSKDEIACNELVKLNSSNESVDIKKPTRRMPTKKTINKNRNISDPW